MEVLAKVTVCEKPIPPYRDTHQTLQHWEQESSWVLVG